MNRSQHAVLQFVHRHYARNGVTPTYREIMAGVTLKSASSAHRLIHALIKKGWLIKQSRGEYRIASNTRIDAHEQDWNVSWAKEVLENAGYRVLR